MRRIVLLLVVMLLLLGQPQPSAARSPRQSATYTVQPGESLSEIAQQVGVPMEELMQLNGIDDPNSIIAGQVLELPAAATAPTATPATDPVPPLPDVSPMSEAPEAPPTPEVLPEILEVQVDPIVDAEAQPTTHTVQPGETLSGIAARYGLTLDDLMQFNGIDDADAIVIGRELRITPTVSTGVAQEPAPAAAEADGIRRSSNPAASLNPVYEVGPGDSLENISLRFGIDVDDLRRLNDLDPESGGLLGLGQQLILPATLEELKVTRPVTPPITPDVPKQHLHIVKVGDSLGKIAQANGLTLADLLAANRIADPDTVYIGQELVIPPQSSVVEESPAVEDEEPAPESPQPPQQIGRPRSGFYHYIVKPGDNMSELARDFDSTILAILEYNNLPDAETVYSGLPLRIPYGPPPLPLRLPPTPLSGMRFLVSLSRQQCWLFRGDHVLYAWQCSTGYGEWITRTGTFAVQSRLELAKSSAYELDMPYWLGIYDVGAFENGIHGLPVRWETGEKIWGGLIGQPATFGCAMLDDDDAAVLFDLAYIGMPVHIVQ